MEPLAQTTFPSQPAQPLAQPSGQAMPQSSTIELKDIHLPEAIDNFPLAPGWWLLAISGLAIAIFSVLKYRAYKKSRQNKKHALQQLKKIQQEKQTNNEQTISILKWAAMQYFPRQQVAQLYGIQFQQFLTDTLPDKHQPQFKQLSNEGFTLLYKKRTVQTSEEPLDLDKQLHQAAELWLNHALPPKKSRQNTEHSLIAGVNQ